MIASDLQIEMNGSKKETKTLSLRKKSLTGISMVVTLFHQSLSTMLLIEDKWRHRLCWTHSAQDSKTPLRSVSQFSKMMTLKMILKLVFTKLMMEATPLPPFSSFVLSPLRFWSCPFIATEDMPRGKWRKQWMFRLNRQWITTLHWVPRIQRAHRAIAQD